MMENNPYQRELTAEDSSVISWAIRNDKSFCRCIKCRNFFEHCHDSLVASYLLEHTLRPWKKFRRGMMKKEYGFAKFNYKTITDKLLWWLHYLFEPQLILIKQLKVKWKYRHLRTLTPTLSQMPVHSVFIAEYLKASCPRVFWVRKQGGTP